MADDYKEFFEKKLTKEKDLWKAFKTRKERKAAKQTDKQRKAIWKVIGAGAVNRRMSSSLTNKVKKILKVKFDQAVNVIVYCIENELLTSIQSESKIKDAHDQLKSAKLRITAQQLETVIDLLKSNDALMDLLIPNGVVKRGQKIISKRTKIELSDARELISFIYKNGLSKLGVKELQKQLNGTDIFSIDLNKKRKINISLIDFNAFYVEMRKVDKKFGKIEKNEAIDELEDIDTTLTDDELRFIAHFIVRNNLQNETLDKIYSLMSKDEEFKKFDNLKKQKKEVKRIISIAKTSYQGIRISEQDTKIEETKRKRVVETAESIRNDFKNKNFNDSEDDFRKKLTDLSRKSSKFLNELGSSDIVEFALQNPDKIIKYAEDVIDDVNELSDDDTDAPNQSVEGIELVKLKEHKEHLLNIGDVEGASKISNEIKERSNDKDAGVERLSKIQEKIRDIMQETLDMQKTHLSKQDIEIKESNKEKEQETQFKEQPKDEVTVKEEKSKFGFLFKLLFGAVGLAAFTYFQGLFEDGNFQKLMDGIKTGNWKQVTEVLGGLDLLKGLIGSLGVTGGIVLLKSAMVGYKVIRGTIKTIQFAIKGIKGTIKGLRALWNGSKAAINWAKGMLGKASKTVQKVAKAGAATASKVASKTKTAAKVGAAVAKDVSKAAKGAKVLSKLTKFAKFIPGLGLALTAGAAIYAGVEGWNNADEILGIEKTKLSWVHRAAQQGGNIVNDATFGFVKTDKTAKLILKAAKTLGFDPNKETDESDASSESNSPYEKIEGEVRSGIERLEIPESEELIDTDDVDLVKSQDYLSALKQVQSPNEVIQSQLTISNNLIQQKIDVPQQSQNNSLNDLFRSDLQYGTQSNKIAQYYGIEN